MGTAVKTKALKNRRRIGGMYEGDTCNCHACGSALSVGTDEIYSIEPNTIRTRKLADGNPGDWLYCFKCLHPDIKKAIRLHKAEGTF